MQEERLNAPARPLVFSPSEGSMGIGVATYQTYKNLAKLAEMAEMAKLAEMAELTEKAGKSAKVRFKSAKSANNSKKVDEVEQSKSANHPTTEANGIGGTDEFTHPAPDSTGQPPPFSGSKGGPVISHQQVEATPPASPLARRILQSLTGVPSGMDANELVRQTGNGKGASMVMMEHELAELAKRGLVNRINGRWVAATPSTMGRGTP